MNRAILLRTQTARKLKKYGVVIAVILVALLCSAFQAWLQIKREHRVPSGISLSVSTSTGNKSGAESKATDLKQGKVIRLSFATLKAWVYVAGKTPIPANIKKLDGKNVEMVGYMMSLSDVKGISEFVLVPALWGCCYGQPPMVNHVVLVKMAPNKTIEYFSGEIRVRGLFSSGEVRQDGYLVSLYQIAATEVVTQ